MVDLSVVGDREEDVDRVLVTIGTVGREFSIRYLARSDNIIVDKVNVTKLQFEFWSGRKGEEQRHRPHHKLEVSISWKWTVASLGPTNVRDADMTYKAIFR